MAAASRYSVNKISICFIERARYKRDSFLWYVYEYFSEPLSISVYTGMYVYRCAYDVDVCM